jgi:putative spermidine/putrescine transport system ATP-binding protein/putrescine transport system ATP-binding protein
MSTLDVVAVSKRFNHQPVLKDVSFSVAQGEIVALLGPSGCGKTTTLRVIAGFETPDAGEIRIGGEDVIRQRPHERNFGFVFQDYALFPHMTVSDNIAYGVRHRRYRASSPEVRVREMLDLVQLGDYARRYPRELSGGQRQRIALARALAPGPAVLLLDEPLSALDAGIRAELRTELRRLLKGLGTTTVIVTHDQEEAMTIAERIVLMNKGTVIQEGRPLEVYDAPNCRFVADFLGSCNWLKGTIIAADGDCTTVQLLDDQSIGASARAGIAAGRSVEIGIRPEHVRPAMAGHESQPGMNQVRGRIADIAISGAQSTIRVDIGAGQIVIISAARRLAETRSAGEELVLLIDPADLLIW